MMKSCYLDAFLLNCSFSSLFRWDGYIFFVFEITLGKDACLYWGLGTAVKIRFLSTAIITSKLYQNIWVSAHLHILAWMTRAFLSSWNIAAEKYKHSKLFFFCHACINIDKVVKYIHFSRPKICRCLAGSYNMFGDKSL